MKVEVRLFAYLRQGRGKKQILEFEEGTTISQVMDMLNIDEDDVSIALINGTDGPIDRQLKDGDVLALFPPVGGG
ncbi:MAG: MoaD/ThiS family protein [Tissierellia bacterium]|nr:MoaD/ThiS family protein [Tissierellia bacterium]